MWDSSTELRYWVAPQQPAGTERFTAEQPAGLATRDLMTGAGLPLSPKGA